MQFLQMYLNFTVKLVEIGFKFLIWAITMTGKAFMWLVSTYMNSRKRGGRWKGR